MRQQFESEIRKVQNDICSAVEQMDGGKFHEDAWTRPGGGGGISRVLQVLALVMHNQQLLLLQLFENSYIGTSWQF